MQTINYTQAITDLGTFIILKTNITAIDKWIKVKYFLLELCKIQLIICMNTIYLTDQPNGRVE